VDSAGDAYATGETGSSNFPITPGAFQTSLRGFGDAFVTKLNSSGSALVYSTYLGGSDYDDAEAIAVDSAGNAYVTGRTTSNDFPTTTGAFQTARGRNYDAVVTKIGAFTFAGRPRRENCHGVSVSALAHKYGSIAAAVSALHFPSVQALQAAIRAFCD